MVRFGFFSICPCCSTVGPFDFYGKVFVDDNMNGCHFKRNTTLPFEKEKLTYLSRFCSVFPGPTDPAGPPSQWSSSDISFNWHTSYIPKAIEENGDESLAIAAPISNLSCLHTNTEKVWNLRFINSIGYNNTVSLTQTVSSGLRYEDGRLEATETLSNYSGYLSLSGTVVPVESVAYYMLSFKAVVGDARYLTLDVDGEKIYLDTNERKFTPDYYPIGRAEGEFCPPGAPEKEQNVFIDFGQESGNSIIHFIYKPETIISTTQPVVTKIKIVDQYSGEFLNASSGYGLDIYDFKFKVSNNNNIIHHTHDIALIDESTTAFDTIFYITDEEIIYEEGMPTKSGVQDIVWTGYKESNFFPINSEYRGIDFNPPFDASLARTIVDDNASYLNLDTYSTNSGTLHRFQLYGFSKLTGELVSNETDIYGDLEVQLALLSWPQLYQSTEYTSSGSRNIVKFRHGDVHPPIEFPKLDIYEEDGGGYKYLDVVNPDPYDFLYGTNSLYVADMNSAPIIPRFRCAPRYDYPNVFSTKLSRYDLDHLEYDDPTADPFEPATTTNVYGEIYAKSISQNFSIYYGNWSTPDLQYRYHLSSGGFDDVDIILPVFYPNESVFFQETSPTHDVLYSYNPGPGLGSEYYITRIGYTMNTQPLICGDLIWADGKRGTGAAIFFLTTVTGITYDYKKWYYGRELYDLGEPYADTCCIYWIPGYTANSTGEMDLPYRFWFDKTPTGEDWDYPRACDGFPDDLYFCSPPLTAKGDYPQAVNMHTKTELIIKIGDTILERMDITKANEAYYTRPVPADNAPDPIALDEYGQELTNNPDNLPTWLYSPSFNTRFTGLSAIKSASYLSESSGVDFVYFERVWSKKSNLPAEDKRPYVGEPTGIYGDPIGWNMIAVNKNGNIMWTLQDNRGGPQHDGSWSGIWNAKIHHPDVIGSSDQFIYVHGFWMYDDQGNRLEQTFIDITGIECGAWRISHDKKIITPLRVIQQGEHNDETHGDISNFAFNHEITNNNLNETPAYPYYHRGELSAGGQPLQYSTKGGNVFDCVKVTNAAPYSPDLTYDLATVEEEQVPLPLPNDYYNLIATSGTVLFDQTGLFINDYNPEQGGDVHLDFDGPPYNIDTQVKYIMTFAGWCGSTSVPYSTSNDIVVQANPYFAVLSEYIITPEVMNSGIKTFAYKVVLENTVDTKEYLSNIITGSL